MIKVVSQKTLMELIEFASASMVKTGYAKNYISSFFNIWNALTRYMAEKKIIFYSSATGIAFLQDRYSILSNCSFEKLSKVDKRRKRAILVLDNCLEHEAVSAPKTYSLCEFASRFEKIFQSFINTRVDAGLSLPTINRDVHCLNNLSNYLDSIKMQSLEELDSMHIIGFMKNQSRGGRLPTLHGAASTLRLFLKFVYDNEHMLKELSTFVPQVKCKPEGIPSVYTKDEIQKLLNSIDRASPRGKRDYCMILLAAKLGMRASDICGLTFDNLKWQTSTIEFIVKKTGEPAVLPLFNEIGEAIIDYIKYGRPLSDDKHIFLRLLTPHIEMKPAALHRIVSNWFRTAGIPSLPGKRSGPHALRASLASAMLDNNTPLPIISEALTHKSSDTTRIYLKIDFQHLRKYALEVPPLGNVWMGGAPQ
jgi:integrase/recombinase XerD